MTSTRSARLGLVPWYRKTTVRHINVGTRHYPSPLCGSSPMSRLSTSREVHALPLCGWCVRKFRQIDRALFEEPGQ